MKQIIVDGIKMNYFITEDGKCINMTTGKELKGQISNSGYLNFNLTFPDGHKRRLYAHRLVALTYIPNELNKLEVNHKDGNKLNNNIKNLEWVTASENQIYNTLMNNKITAKKVYQFDTEKKLIKEYLSLGEVERNGFTRSLVEQECAKEIKELTLGYYWSYKNDNSFQTFLSKNCGVPKRVAQYDLQDNLINTFSSANEAARYLGVSSHSHISECCRGKIKTYKGFKWLYI